MDILIYLFHPVPGSKFNYYIPLIIFAAVLLGASYYLKNRSKKDKQFRRIFRNTSSHLVTLSLITLLFLGARYERIPYISSRFLLLLTLGITAYVLVRMVKKFKKDLPEEIQKAQKNTVEKKKVYSHSKKKK